MISFCFITFITFLVKPKRSPKIWKCFWMQFMADQRDTWWWNRGSFKSTSPPVFQLESYRRPAFTELLDELGEIAETLDPPTVSQLTTSWAARSLNDGSPIQSHHAKAWEHPLVLLPDVLHRELDWLHQTELDRTGTKSLLVPFGLFWWRWTSESDYNCLKNILRKAQSFF